MARQLSGSEIEAGGVGRSGVFKSVQGGSLVERPENFFLEDKEGGHEADSTEPSSRLRI